MTKIAIFVILSLTLVLSALAGMIGTLLYLDWRRKNPARKQRRWIFALWLALLGVILGLALSLSIPAHGATCMSREAARAKWPRTYLYWHYGDRKQKCWSNVRAKITRHRPAKPVIEIVEPNEFNRIDAQAPPAPPTLIDRFRGEPAK